MLHSNWVGAKGAARTAVILHGIMGSGRNWRTPAKKLAEQHPGWGIVCLDHLGHGSSPAAPDATIEVSRRPSAPDTDLLLGQLCAARIEEKLTALGCSPDVVIGHSFGGKVCCEARPSC